MQLLVKVGNYAMKMDILKRKIEGTVKGRLPGVSLQPALGHQSMMAPS